MAVASRIRLGGCGGNGEVRGWRLEARVLKSIGKRCRETHPAELGCLSPGLEWAATGENVLSLPQRRGVVLHLVVAGATSRAQEVLTAAAADVQVVKLRLGRLATLLEVAKEGVTRLGAGDRL